MKTNLSYRERMTFRPVVLENVVQTYTGREGACCCGCAGRHVYREVTRVAAGKSRGYAVGDEEISERSVASTVKRINAALAAGVVPETRDDSLVAVVVNGRLLIAYLRPYVGLTARQ